MLNKKEVVELPTSKANKDIVTSIFISIFIAILILAFFTHTYIEKKEEKTPTAAQAVTTGSAAFYLMPACSFNLSQGWNFISFCASETNTNITAILGSQVNQTRFILEWNTSTQEFLVYSPKAATPPFSTFNLSKSYFIYYNDPTSTIVSLTGPAFGDTNISLEQGWETPNYPYAFTSNITQYLNTISGKYRFLQKWNYSAQEFIIYSALSSNNPFYQIDMGEGQFILITDSGGADLFYNKTKLENG